MDHYEVHSYHLNINTGDSAVHILVGVNSSGQKEIEELILIDGGFSDIGERNISEFLSCLGRSNYKKPVKLTFDTIIITHWDQDHFRGIEELFRKDIDKHLHGPVLKDEVTFKNFVEKEYRSSFCEYDKDGEPKTTLYCPFWNTAPAPSSWTNTQEGYLKIRCVKKIGMEECTADAPKVVLINAKYKDMVGLDFFTNKKVSEVDLVEIESPQFVAEELNKRKPKKPALFCVRSNGVMCGPWKSLANWSWYQNDNLKTITLKKAPQKTGSDTDDSQRIGVDLVERGDPTVNNESSIACMVIWPTIQDPSNHDTYISHYFGGDLGEDSEEEILRWSTVPSKFVPNVRHAITVLCMKLSHHGMQPALSTT